MNPKDMIAPRETDIRISDLIKILRKMKREHGNLRVANTWINGEVRVRDKTYPPKVNQLKILKGRQYKNTWAFIPHDEVDTSEKFCNL